MQPHLLAATAGTTAGKQVMALHLVDQLELLNRQQPDFDTRLAAAITAHPDGPLFASFPGIGTVTAGTMIAEMGDDRARFPAPERCWPSPGWPQSPEPRAAPARSLPIRREQAPAARYRPVDDRRRPRRSQEPTQIYAQARAAGQGRYRAYCGLGARWTRILWRAWTDHQPFDLDRVDHVVVGQVEDHVRSITLQTRRLAHSSWSLSGWMCRNTHPSARPRALASPTHHAQLCEEPSNLS